MRMQSSKSRLRHHELLQIIVPHETCGLQIQLWRYPENERDLLRETIRGDARNDCEILPVDVPTSRSPVASTRDEPSAPQEISHCTPNWVRSDSRR